MKTEWVVLYHTSMWRSIMNKAAPDNIKKFTWYSCASKIYDEDSKRYFAKLLPSCKFFNPETGQTKTLKIRDEPYFLLIIDQKEKDSKSSSKKKTLSIDTKIKYSGYAYEKCDTTRIKYNSRLCNEAMFGFFEDVLVEGERCELTDYSRVHNAELHRILGKFPSVKTIEDKIQKEGCYETSKYLYHEFYSK